MKKTAWLNRNFVFLLLGQIMSLLGNGTLKFALAMYVLERTGSAAVFAGMLSASMLPTIALSPFGGVLADRMNRRTLMIALDALSGLAALMAGAALPLGYDLPLITVLLVALSALGAFESPTVQACVPQMLSGDALEKATRRSARRRRWLRWRPRFWAAWSTRRLAWSPCCMRRRPAFC